MKRSFTNLLMIIMILVSLFASGIQATPARALGTMQLVDTLPALPAQVTWGNLNSVWGPNATQLYAVGYGSNGTGTAKLPLVYRKNGTTWSSSIASMPAGWTAGTFEGVWTPTGTTDSAFAVGSGGVNQDNLTSPMISRWDGSTWTSIIPRVPSSDWSVAQFYGVWGSSATNVWAVGYGGGAAGGTTFTDMPLVSHWTGGTWETASWTSQGLGLPANYTHAYLTSIWGSSASDIYAAGSGLYVQGVNSWNMPLLFHYNGTSWSAVTLTLPTGWTGGKIESIWGSGNSDIYAVGTGQSGGYSLPLLYHGSGTSWMATALPLPTTGWTSGYMFGVWGASASEVYAVGYGYDGSISKTVPIMYRKTSTGWAASNYPFTGWSPLLFQGIWGSAANDVYAIGTGQYNNGGKDLPILAHAIADTAAPGAVTGFRATIGITSGTYNLSWIAPTDDAGNNNSGPVDSYLVKYSTSPFTNWSQGTLITTGLPAPAMPGFTQYMTVSGLSANTQYYFAIMAQDEQSNFSDYVTTSPVLGSGIYDDSSSYWNYLGTWTAYTGPGPANNTMHYTTTVGDKAELQFSGKKFTLTFAKYSNRGSFKIWLDDTTLVTTIDASSSSLLWQQTYTSPEYTDGNHKITIENMGPAGKYVDIDSIQIFGPPQPVQPGTYQDDDSNWVYTGTWTAYTGSGPSGNTMHYTSTVGDKAELLFTGTKFTLTFTKNSNRGSFKVWLDDTTLVTTIDASSSSLLWQQTYTSPEYTNGNHKITIENMGPAGKYVDIDAIRIFGPPQYVPAGTYQDDDSNWVYTGTWTAYTGSGPSGNTMHYTSTVGDKAELLFTGTKFTLTFAKNSNRGSFRVWLDDTTLVTTIDASSSSLLWQQIYTSPEYTNGNHKITIENMGPAGKYVDVDAIRIFGPPQYVPAGTYQDDDGNWVYTGTWTAYTGSGPSGNTMHYTSTVGDKAELLFTGTKFTLTFAKYSNRGSFKVWLDDTTLVTTIDASSSSLLWQQTYVSPSYTNGNHKITIENMGPAGKYIDVDAITIE